MPEPFFSGADVTLLRLSASRLREAPDHRDYPADPYQLELLSTRIDRWLEMVRQHPYVVFAND